MDLGWTRYAEEQEKAFRHLCILNAALFGYLPEQAENCDEGTPICPKCPFTDDEWNKEINIFLNLVETKRGKELLKFLSIH